MHDLVQLLNRTRNGNAVLFCGAGFTADSLNFSDPETLGVTHHLLTLFNDELKASGKDSGYKNIQNAARAYKKEFGQTRLMSLLKDRFSINKVSNSIVDILRFPWRAIYTTNYDNGIEIGLQLAGKPSISLNNTDKRPPMAKAVQVVHLHGRSDAWNVENFESSCVLDSDSYRSLTNVTTWLEQLRIDLERAELVVFSGFSAADFHISNTLFDTTGLREKTYFINRVSAHPNVDEKSTQEQFGLPCFIGREVFAGLVTDALTQSVPAEPPLASFRRYNSPKPAAELPSVQAIEALLIWGEVDYSQVKRDQFINKSDYHILRSESDLIVNRALQKGSVVLLSGDICEGKSLILADVADRLSASRPVFELKATYADLLDEISGILLRYPNAVFLIEDGLSFREQKLVGISHLIAGSDGAVIFTSRSISTEGETGKLKSLRMVNSFIEIPIGRLSGIEADSLVDLIEQIAGWSEFRAFSRADRRRVVLDDCDGSISNVLLRVIESRFVQEKYLAEYNKSLHLDQRDRQSIIAALLIANIGVNARTSFLSNIFERDFAGVLNQFSSATGGLRLVRVEAGLVKTVPSVGARNLLRNVVSDRDVVNTTIFILERMAGLALRGDADQHIFSQLMRYSILSSTVTDTSEVNRFFDHVSKIGAFRDMPLFWLQWHMAMSAQGRWSYAESYLKTGYAAADSYEKRRGVPYNRRHLDDRRAKYLAAHSRAINRRGAELFRDLKEALDIAGRLLRGQISYHPFETLKDIASAFEELGDSLVPAQKDLIEKQLQSVSDRATKALEEVPMGVQREIAERALKETLATLK